MSINSYIYTHKKNYLKNPENSQAIGNFRGQVYEASFYEWLKDNVNYPNMKLVAKSPYIKRVNVNDGFYNSKDGSCCYSSCGVTLFEFDALCCSENLITFYECFLSKSSQNIKSHENTCKRKTTFLQKIFPNHTIKCIFVSNINENLDLFGVLDGIELLVYPEPEVDLKKIAIKNKPKELTLTSNMIEPEKVTQIAKRFDYISLQMELAESFNKSKNIQDITQQIISYGEVVKRLHIGAIDASFLKEEFNFKGMGSVILSLDFTNIIKPTLRYYIYQNGVSELKLNKKPKILDQYKASRKELLLLKKKIKPISNSDYLDIYSIFECKNTFR